MGGGGAGKFVTAANASIALRETVAGAGAGVGASLESSFPDDISNAFGGRLTTPPKMEPLEVSLYSDPKNESLRSAVVVVVIVSDLPPPLLRTEKPLLNAENLKT
jgi:hypothetical protein